MCSFDPSLVADIQNRLPSLTTSTAVRGNDNQTGSLCFGVGSGEGRGCLALFPMADTPQHVDTQGPFLLTPSLRPHSSDDAHSPKVQMLKVSPSPHTTAQDMGKLKAEVQMGGACNKSYTWSYPSE